MEPIIHFRIVMFIFYLFGSSAFLSFCVRHRKAVDRSASHHQSDCSISDGLLRQRARKKEAPRDDDKSEAAYRDGAPFVRIYCNDFRVPHSAIVINNVRRMDPFPTCAKKN